jgi:hemerythrin-like domain-containing protein
MGHDAVGTGWAEVCDYCGCNGVEPIRELMDEHEALMDEAHDVRQALSRGDEALAMSRLACLVGHLGRHVRREEAGVFRALRDKGEFLEELTELEAEHRQFDQTITALHTGASDFTERLSRMLDDLGEHVEREDLGIFPVSVVTLGASGWQVVDTARAESPSFLLDRQPTV